MRNSGKRIFSAVHIRNQYFIRTYGPNSQWYQGNICTSNTSNCMLNIRAGQATIFFVSRQRQRDNVIDLQVQKC